MSKSRRKLDVAQSHTYCRKKAVPNCTQGVQFGTAFVSLMGETGISGCECKPDANRKRDSAQPKEREAQAR
jgi:hypothetical protein